MAICRSSLLATCLDAVAALDYPDDEVVVVDNAPVNLDVADLVDSRRWLKACGPQVGLTRRGGGLGRS